MLNMLKETFIIGSWIVELHMKDMPPGGKISMTLVICDLKDYEGGYSQIFGGNVLVGGKK